MQYVKMRKRGSRIRRKQARMRRKTTDEFFSEEYVFCLEEDGRGLGSRVSLELLLLEVLVLS